MPVIAVKQGKPWVQRLHLRCVALAPLVRPVALAVSLLVAILTQASFSVIAAAGEGAATVRAPVLEGIETGRSKHRTDTPSNCWTPRLGNSPTMDEA
jgi:hypothetical protein